MFAVTVFYCTCTIYWGVLMKNWSNTSLCYSDLENWLKILIIINLVLKLKIKPWKLLELNEFLAKFDLSGMLSLWSATAQWSLSGRCALYGLFHSTVNYSLWYRMIYTQPVPQLFIQYVQSVYNALLKTVSSTHPSNFCFQLLKLARFLFFAISFLPFKAWACFICVYINFQEYTEVVNTETLGTLPKHVLTPHEIYVYILQSRM